jgi:predicted outer membrane repeat protein
VTQSRVRVNQQLLQHWYIAAAAFLFFSGNGMGHRGGAISAKIAVGIFLYK